MVGLAKISSLPQISFKGKEPYISTPLQHLFKQYTLANPDKLGRKVIRIKQ
jgi:hypothetical protein